MTRTSPSTPSCPVVAIVDDDMSIRDAIEDYLHAYGYESRAFCSAEDYLTSSACHDVDCIVTDVKMAGMSGLELQRRLMNSPLARPVIFMTSYEDEDMRALALRRGAVAFLGKPVPMTELARQIDKALKS